VSRAIADAASAALSDAGVPHRIQWAGSMFSVFFRDAEVRTYDDARAQDTTAFGRFFHSMLGSGVYLPPSAFESWFVSGAHDDEALDRVVSALPAAAVAAASAPLPATTSHRTSGPPSGPTSGPAATGSSDPATTA
jgi:glutamate-1-semialdehyde 2,1-aminomutase